MIVCNSNCRYIFASELRKSKRQQTLKLIKMNTEEIYYFEDWVNNMLNDSDYTEFELMQFEEYYQNLLTFEENTQIFMNLENLENLKI